MEHVCGYSQPKKPRIYWRKDVVKTFLEACIQEIALNGREGGSLKPVSWKNVAETLKTTHNFIVEQRQMKNQYDCLKGKYGAWSKLKNKAGDVYDPLTNTFNLTEEEWQIEMKSNKYIQRLRSARLLFPELCLQLFDGVVSTRVGDRPVNRTEESCDSTQDPLASAGECSSRLQTQIEKRKACTIRTTQIEESHRPTDEHLLQQDAHQEVMVQKLDVDAHPPSKDPDLVPVGSPESSSTGRSYVRCLGSPYSDEVEIEEPQRPIGRNKGSGASTSTSTGLTPDESVNHLLGEIKTFNNRVERNMKYKWKKLELKRKELELERKKVELQLQDQFDKDIEFFCTPHDHLTGIDLAATLDKKERIRKRHNL